MTTVLYVVRAVDDEGSVIEYERVYTDKLEAEKDLERLLEVFKKRNWVIEEEKDNWYVAVSNKNPLMRVNIYMVPVIRV